MLVIAVIAFLCFLFIWPFLKIASIMDEEEAKMDKKQEKI